MMRLAEVVARYPTGRLATPEDNTRILEFFERLPMQTSAFGVQYRRQPDFFRLLRYQADRAHVILSVDGMGAVRALGTISLRPGWVDGRPTTIGYLGDLRVALDRRLATRWRRFYGELLAHAGEIEELADCTHWLTTIMDDNRVAHSTLNSGRPHLPSYVPLASFTMRNLIARLLPAPRLNLHTGWHVGQAGLDDRERLAAFFEEQNRCLPFGFRGDFERRLASWGGLRITDFIYVAERGNIIGCVAPWSPLAAKQTFVSRVPRSLRLLGWAARALPGRPIRIPKLGEPFRIAYLTHLTFAARLGEASRATVFRAMLDYVLDGRRNTDWHCLALCDFAQWDLGRVLGRFVQKTIPITIYAVVPPGSPSDHLAALRRTGPPAFEMAMV